MDGKKGLIEAKVPQNDNEMLLFLVKMGIPNIRSYLWKVGNYPQSVRVLQTFPPFMDKPHSGILGKILRFCRIICYCQKGDSMFVFIGPVDNPSLDRFFSGYLGQKKCKVHNNFSLRFLGIAENDLE